MSVRVSMFKVDFWLAYGLGGLVQLINDRVRMQMGFQKKVVDMYIKSQTDFKRLMPHIRDRQIESYPPREETIDQIDSWATVGLMGIVKMVNERVKTIDKKMDSGCVERMRRARDLLDATIREVELVERVPAESSGLTSVED